MSGATPPPTLILAGPTAVGKTELAVELARRHGYELVSADSMQVYRGLEIGTGQPTPEQLRGVPLHGCGALDPAEPFSVKHFVDLCAEYAQAIRSRGRTPLFVGGSGMYLRALRWGLFEAPPVPISLRRRLRKDVETLGVQALHARLSRLDPAAAGRIPATDPVRIVRALEVAETSGRSITSLQTQWPARRARFPHRLIVLTCPRAALARRINRRVEAMLAKGWIEEVRRLLESGRDPTLHCFKALGYRQVLSHLAGGMTRPALVAEIQAKTRQFARRQLTWLRKEADARWIAHGGEDPLQALSAAENWLAAAAPEPL